MSKTVLVTGATGRQGGAVVKALLDTDYEILALTRNASSPSAQKLAASPNVKLLQGDLDDSKAIFVKARELTKNPIWGVFAVQGKPAGDAEIEVTLGKSLIDAAITADVQFFVYSSVDRGGARSSSDPTPVAHWATKHRLEQYLEERTAPTKMRYTVLRPTGFMENISNDFLGKAMASMWQSALKDKPFQMIATKDIGWFGAQALKFPDDFAGRYVSLAGAELSYKEANAIFKEKFGKDMPTTFGIVAHVLMKVVEEINVMFKWLKHHDNGGNIEECRRMHPGLMDFGTWLEKESQFRGA